MPCQEAAGIIAPAIQNNKSASMSDTARPFPADIYTEPSDVDVDTLKNLGPLAGLAGIWEGTRGLDVKPKADGPRKQAYVERIELQPIDPATNGPQLLYGLRYHTFITKPNNVKTYHDQVGYWLWEPATGGIIHTLTIPARPGGDGLWPGQRQREELRGGGDGGFDVLRHPLRAVPGACLPHGGVPHAGDDQRTTAAGPTTRTP